MIQKILDMKKDNYSLTEFKENACDIISHVKKTRKPITLTINDKAEVVIIDLKTYQELKNNYTSSDLLRF